VDLVIDRTLNLTDDELGHRHGGVLALDVLF